MKGQLRIDSLFAFAQIDTDGTEGVVAMKFGDGWMPLMGADLAMVAKLRPIAQHTATVTGRPVVLSHYSACGPTRRRSSHERPCRLLRPPRQPAHS